MLQYIFDGGPLMYPIVALLVVGLAVIIDRAVAFNAATRNNKALTADVIALLEDNDIEGAAELCAKIGGPVAAVLLVGIQKFGKLVSKDEKRSNAEMSAIVKTSMEDYAPQIVATMDRNIGILPIVAGLSPLLGMTGTVTGMINSFDSMATQTNLEATAVSGGISEALITTAAGLLVAMPAVIAYNIFTKLEDGAVSEIDKACTALVDFIALDYKNEA
ncbi:MAG: MotA/TolQ/ExbB proton channel family protein [Lentisphaeria bacterium]|nr:MotA/TolQ/ExbB proton channel family protein [Lentisphaeria bacterium]